MARGSTKETAEKERERRTAELFRQLESVNRPAEKQPLVNELAELNLPLCDALAKRYAGRGCDREDLLQVARVGLLAAIGRFRPGDGTSFAGFAVPTIAGELKRHFRDNCWVVRPPRRVQELRPQALIARVELTQEYGREPNLSELASSLGESPGVVRASLDASDSYRPLSLDRPAQPDSGVRLVDTLAEETDEIGTLLDRLDLQRAVRALPARERRMLRWRFVEGLSQAAIAERLGVSQMQVSRMLRAILGQLRCLLGADESCAA
ncbi:MAG: sigma-70 family RNA polymerase sigma factor [Tessaracoccus sp.]